MSSEPPVTVAMMRSRQPPDTTAVALAHTALMQGARFFFFNPRDVDLAARRISGRFYENGTWRRRVTGYPDAIDNDTYVPPIPEVWEEMVRCCRLTTPRMENKEAMYARLRKANLLADLLIPSVGAEGPETLVEQIALHGSIVVKPIGGRRGEDVMFLQRHGAAYRGNFNGRNWILKGSDLPSFYERMMRKQPFLVQKYVHSRTAQGLPCDLRLVIRRGAGGAWQHVRLVGRIGSGRTVTSNVSGGGSVCDGAVLLRNRLPKQADRLLARLEVIARDFPPAFQALHQGYSFDAIGLDIGFDEDGTPWLFEVNSGPADTYWEMQDAVPRMAYAMFLARNPDHPDAIVRG
jgi:glutathione synthase/RimK-type ligase-like ATP-grasp enzyme